MQEKKVSARLETPAGSGPLSGLLKPSGKAGGFDSAAAMKGLPAGFGGPASAGPPSSALYRCFSILSIPR